MKRKFKERREVNSGEIIVETAGFRPLGVIIHTLEVAGEQLMMSRMEEFVYDKTVEEEISEADKQYVDDDCDSLIDLPGQLRDKLLLSFSEESGDKSGVDRNESDGEGAEPEVVSDSE